jgi:hypothetical protein
MRQFRGWSNIPLTLLATEGLEERSASSCCCSSIVSCSKPPARSGQGRVWAYQPIYPLRVVDKAEEHGGLGVASVPGRAKRLDLFAAALATDAGTTR